MHLHALRCFLCAAIAFLVVSSLAPFVYAQAQGFNPKLLLRTTLSGDDAKEVVIGTAEYAPRATTGRHTHPGDEYGVVLQGTLEIRADGQSPVRVNTGEAFHNVKGIIHETRNVGEDTARVAVTFVLDKGKPLSQPAK